MSLCTNVLSTVSKARLTRPCCSLLCLQPLRFSHCALRTPLTPSRLRRVFPACTQVSALHSSNPLGDKNSERERERDEEIRKQHRRAMGQPPGGGPEQPPAEMGPLLLNLAILYLLFSILYDTEEEITFQQFVDNYLKSGEVARIRVDNHNAHIILHQGARIDGKDMAQRKKCYFKVRPGDTVEAMLVPAFQRLGVSPMEVPVIHESSANWKVPLLAILVVYRLLWGRVSVIRSNSMLGNVFRMSEAQPLIVKSPVDGIRFSDVAGMQEAKEEIREFVDYLKTPKRFHELGARIPKGAILTGPPGTGKTLLAKAVSTEAGVPFLAMAGSDFVEMVGGVGASRVRSLFSQAKSCAPCIIFIDEVDAVGRKRGEAAAGMDNSESEQTLNQLLVEMDGMEKLEGVVVMASTNRVDILDSALLRPGRFDRKIEIALPTQAERRDIFETHLRKLQLEEQPHLYARRLASLTPGQSGADIANICNEAALHAGREDQSYVKTANFEYAVERILAGSEKRSISVPQNERQKSAGYEAGRCLVAWQLQHCAPPLKTSILPRTTSALGYTQFAPTSKLLETTEQIDHKLCALVGGRAAELVLYGGQSSLGERHLKQATELAEMKIEQFGMGESMGQVSFDKTEANSVRFYSNSLRHKLDQEVARVVRQANVQAVEILRENKDLLEKLTAALREKEVLNYKDLLQILGDPPHIKDSFLEL